jgi:hypothetical protein
VERVKATDGALRLLLLSARLEGEAREVGVAASTAEATRELSLLEFDRTEGATFEGLPSDRTLRDLLTSSQVRQADQVEAMRLALLARRIKAKRLERAETEVTPAQIAAYYRANRSRMVIPERRYFEILMTHDRARALTARREVEAGRDFLAVARRAGFDPEAPHGLQALSPGEEERAFRRVIFHAKLHRLVGPVAQSVDYYVMRLLAIRRPRVAPLSGVRGPIRRTLAARLLAGRIEPQAERRWATRTTCAQGRLLPACQRVVAAGV